MSAHTTPRAFPSAAIDDAFGGMALRDWFAGQVLNGFLSRPVEMPIDLSVYIRVSFDAADEMMAERAKPVTTLINNGLVAALEGLEFILARAESNASGTPDWEHVSGRIEAARNALAAAKGGAA